jgi:hypothetical protein
MGHTHTTEKGKLTSLVTQHHTTTYFDSKQHFEIIYHSPSKHLSSELLSGVAKNPSVSQLP